jgi:hypothetical protein
MFERLVALRMAEEALDEAEAVALVIRDNLYGLEIDPRCTQIAAFNLALAAWRRVGYCTLPPMNLACSGLAPNTSEEEWLRLADGNEKLENGMASLYQLFENAPVLGSLINPRAGEGDLLEAGFDELRPLLDQVLVRESSTENLKLKTENYLEMAVTARGLAKAAEILAGQFTLVATNVPYLGRLKQDSIIRDYCENTFPSSKADLATCFIERGLELCDPGGTSVAVVPQIWLFLKSYERLRRAILKSVSWNIVSKLGTKAFESISGEVVNVTLQVLTKIRPDAQSAVCGLDVGEEPTAQQKKDQLLLREPSRVSQFGQLENPNSTIVFEASSGLNLLSVYAESVQGASTLDIEMFRLRFWEINAGAEWVLHQSTPSGCGVYSGLEFASIQRNPGGRFEKLALELKAENRLGGAWSGQPVWGKLGIACAWMGSLPTAIYLGAVYDNSIAAIVPKDVMHLSAIWCYCSSDLYVQDVRKINQKAQVANATLVQVPFDLAYWQKVAAEKYPHGLPKPFSSAPTQWLFSGYPKDSDNPLQVAVARLCGYQWPRQTGSSFPDCPALGPDGIEGLADKDGIVCIPPVRGEAGAADRLLNLLVKAYGQAWSSDILPGLLKDADYAGKGLETWLRDGFFQQHCELFHQRPFIWHVWDGLRDGFSALVNYHKLDRKNLETLIYTYLGDWMTRQSQDIANGVDGAQERLSAAEQLKKRLELILAGEAPHDIFIRWKPLHQQPIGWEPDINDGVRMNIRPFLSIPDVKAKGAGILRVKPKIKWEKDRGKEPQRSKDEYPWFWGWDEKTIDFTSGPEFKGERFNDCHYTIALKQRARQQYLQIEGNRK